MTNITSMPDIGDVSPLARRVARLLDIEIGSLHGRGPNGRIMMRDVHTRRSAPIRRDSPRFAALTVELRFGRLLDLLREIEAAMPGTQIAPCYAVLKAFAISLERVPTCHVTVQDGAVEYCARADIAVVVGENALPRVVTGAASMPLSGIARALPADIGETMLRPSGPEARPCGTATFHYSGDIGWSFPELDHCCGLTLGGDGQTAAVQPIVLVFDRRVIDPAQVDILLGSIRDFVEAPMGLLA